MTTIKSSLPITAALIPTDKKIGDTIKQAVTGARSGDIAKTQGQQLDQLQKGVASGTISEKEAAEALKQQAAISNAVKVAQSDGFISAAEAKAIKEQQSKAGGDLGKAGKSNEVGSLFQDAKFTEKQAKQIGDLSAGIKSGELDGAEASKLLEGQANIAEGAAKSQDGIGKMSASDLKKLTAQQSAAGLNAALQSHDGQKAAHAKKSDLPTKTEGKPAPSKTEGKPHGGKAEGHGKAGHHGKAEGHGKAQGHGKAEGHGKAGHHGKAEGGKKGDKAETKPTLPQLPKDTLEKLTFKPNATKLADTQSKQLKQIQDGVAKGTISEKEAQGLLKEQAALAEAMKRAESDKKLSPAEMKAFEAQQAKAGKNIAKATQSNELSSLFQDSKVTQAQAAQIGKIADGIKSGELSADEAAKQLGTQADIAGNTAKSQNGVGQMSADETKKIAEQQAKAGESIKTDSTDKEKGANAKPTLPHLPPDILQSLNFKPNATKLANTQSDQLKQIQDGVAKGTISEKEAQGLLKEQAALSEAMKRAESDKKLSPAEMKAFEAQQAKAGENIAKATQSNEVGSLFQDAKVTQAQADQIGKIADGIKSGELSADEAAKQLGTQANIAGNTAKAQNGIGQMSAAETKKIAEQQAKAGESIKTDSTDKEKGANATTKPQGPQLPPDVIEKLTFKPNATKLANTQSDQLKQIQDGVAKGTISEKEAAGLLKEQAALSEAMKRAASDHKLSPDEMKSFQEQQAKAGANISKATQSRELSSLARPTEFTKKQAEQIGQIAEGIKSGQLSNAEANQLLTNQSTTAQNAADSQGIFGQMNPLQQAVLGLQQAISGMQIAMESHDKEHGDNFKSPVLNFPSHNTGIVPGVIKKNENTGIAGNLPINQK